MKTTFRWFLRLFPSRFRARYGEELVDVLSSKAEEARERRGTLGALRMWAFQATDLMRSAVSERRTERKRSPMNRQGRGDHIMATFWQDVRYAIRTSVQRPGFTAVAVVTLALGIGANTAIFSVTRAALMRSAPVLEPERLAAIWTTCRRGDPRCSSSYPDYRDYRDRSAMFEDIAGYSFERANLGNPNGSRLLSVQASTGNYFDVLGLSPEIGRLFNAEDEQQRRTVAVLSHDLWRDQFGSDREIVGGTIQLNRATFEVVGVTPAGFRGLHLDGGSDAYIPLLSGPALASGFLEDDSRFEQRDSRWIDQLVGRLAPGATIAQARAEMLSISDQLAAEDPDARGPRKITVDPAHRLILPIGNGADLERFVILLSGVVGFTLLLACANLGNLLLARAASRQREISLRLAIGASRGRLVRQLMTESLVLAVAGGLTGLLVAGWVLTLLENYQLPGGVAISYLEAEIDRGMLLFTLGLSVLTGMAFGSIPAAQATGRQLETGLRDGGRGTSRGASRLRGILVAAQVALCLVLLVGSGLFLQALWNGLDTDLGFPAEGLALASFDLSLLNYAPEQAQLFVDTLVERVEALPGVTAAGIGRRAPLLPGGQATLLEAVEGYDLPPDEELRLEFNLVDEGYFRALGLPVLEGRGPTAADRTGSRVIVINEDMARRWWPDRSAVGGRVIFFGGSGSAEVVGVVSNTKWDDGIAIDNYPFAYFPATESNAAWAGRRNAMLARTTRDPAALLPLLRDEIRAIDPNVSLIRLQTMEQLLDTELMPQRMGATLLTCFGLLALTLAAVGIYGVVGYTVSQRARDLGVRIALGADNHSILAHVMGGMLVPVSLGLLAGVAAALFLSRAITGFLYGITPTDPVTFLAMGLFLLAIATMASFLPALRATRVDPIVVLRAE